MVDIHCHLLPGVDDGSKSWEMSEEMCQVAAADGISHIVCTPHANDEYPYDRDTLKRSLEELRVRTLAQGLNLEFSLGCDFHFSYDNIQAALSDPDRFTISGTDYLLVEFSDYSISPAAGDALQRFISMGLTPIVTHPERNLTIQKKPEMVLRFAELGCVIQLTANSLTGHWGEGAKKMCRWLLDRDAAHVFASDAHDPSFRPPVLSRARDTIASQYGEVVAKAVVDENPLAIIENRPLPFFPEPSRNH